MGLENIHNNNPKWQFTIYSLEGCKCVLCWATVSSFFMTSSKNLICIPHMGEPRANKNREQRESTWNMSWTFEKHFSNHAIWCVLALVIQIALPLNKFSFLQTIQLEWAHAVYTMIFKRRAKSFCELWLEGEEETKRSDQKERRWDIFRAESFSNREGGAPLHSMISLANMTKLIKCENASNTITVSSLCVFSCVSLFNVYGILLVFS